MNRQLITASLLFILATSFSLYALTNHGKHNPSNPTSSNPGLTLYYGDTCPHCKIVEEYVAINQLKLNSKEVYNNEANANEMVERAKGCGLDTTSIGVPFLWTGHSCLIGDQPIIDFLGTMNQKSNSFQSSQAK